MYRTQLLKLPLQDCSARLTFRLDPVIFPPANILLPGARRVWSLCKRSCTCTNSGTSGDTHVPPVLELHRNKYGDGRCWHCYRIRAARATYRSPKKADRCVSWLRRFISLGVFLTSTAPEKERKKESGGRILNMERLKARAPCLGTAASRTRDLHRGWVTTALEPWGAENLEEPDHNLGLRLPDWIQGQLWHRLQRARDQARI